MENTDIHTITHTPESANADNLPLDASAFKDNLPPKRGRGRPAKYAKEEREQKYKEASKQWHKEHIEDRNSYLKDYQERSRTALKLLAEMWDQGIIIINSENYEGKVRNLLDNRQKIMI